MDKPTVTLTWNAETQGVEIKAEGFSNPGFVAAVCEMAHNHFQAQANFMIAQQLTAELQQAQQMRSKLIRGGL